VVFAFAPPFDLRAGGSFGLLDFLSEGSLAALDFFAGGVRDALVFFEALVFFGRVVMPESPGGASRP
jgi:hypothetical protein